MRVEVEVELTARPSIELNECTFSWTDPPYSGSTGGGRRCQRGQQRGALQGQEDRAGTCCRPSNLPPPLQQRQSPNLTTKALILCQFTGTHTYDQVGMPAAFSPTCSVRLYFGYMHVSTLDSTKSFTATPILPIPIPIPKQLRTKHTNKQDKHLPGYLAALSQFKTKGVDKVAVLCVNDFFTAKAWGKAQKVICCFGVVPSCGKLWTRVDTVMHGTIPYQPHAFQPMIARRRHQHPGGRERGADQGVGAGARPEQGPPRRAEQAVRVVVRLRFEDLCVCQILIGWLTGCWMRVIYARSSSPKPLEINSQQLLRRDRERCCEGPQCRAGWDGLHGVGGGGHAEAALSSEKGSARLGGVGGLGVCVGDK